MAAAASDKISDDDDDNGVSVVHFYKAIRPGNRREGGLPSATPASKPRRERRCCCRAPLS